MWVVCVLLNFCICVAQTKIRKCLNHQDHGIDGEGSSAFPYALFSQYKTAVRGVIWPFGEIHMYPQNLSASPNSILLAWVIVLCLTEGRNSDKACELHNVWRVMKIICIDWQSDSYIFKDWVDEWFSSHFKVCICSCSGAWEQNRMEIVTQTSLLTNIFVHVKCQNTCNALHISLQKAFSRENGY